MSKQDEYVATMQAQLDELNVRMGELEAKGKDVERDVRDAYHGEMNKLRDLSASAFARLEELKATGGHSWESTVAEMENTRDAFKRSFRYFKSQI